MIGNIAPNHSSSENTLNTLRYSDRVKDLKNPNKKKENQVKQDPNDKNFNDAIYNLNHEESENEEEEKYDFDEGESDGEQHYQN